MSIYTALFSHGRGVFLHNVARKYFTLGSFLVSPLLLVINAPFGRFTPKSPSIPLLLDGIKSWIVMELVSPTLFLFAYFSAPLSQGQRPEPTPALGSPQSLFALLFLVHYANRAVISPLRTPSRSKSHIIVPLAGVTFNTINGFLMGAYFSSPYARMRFSSFSLTNPRVAVGLGLWAAGLIGNIVHDEILLNIRRKARVGKGKGKEGEKQAKGEHYAIPQGLLYKYVSYPNYFCEWVEWFGFALASSPFPFSLSLSSLTLSSLSSLISKDALLTILREPASLFAPNLAPPYIFLLTEFLLMFPRAWKGHLWYKEKFGERYPKERRVVVPFVF